MSNKETSNHYTETTEDSGWFNLANELEEEMKEAAEISEEEGEEIEQANIEKNDLADLHDAEYYRQHEDEINDLIKDIIHLRGEKSVKKGEWDQDQKTHLDKNGMPTDYAHLVRYVKDNPDALETLTAEYKNLKYKEAEDITKKGYNARTNEGSTARDVWQEQWDKNLKEYFGDDETALDIANEFPIQDGESVKDFVARVWKQAIMRDNAEKIGGPAPDEARDDYHKRVNYLAQFDVDKPIWGQMNDEQKKDFRERFPRSKGEDMDAWRARVEKQLRVKVWENTPDANAKKDDKAKEADPNKKPEDNPADKPDDNPTDNPDDPNNPSGNPDKPNGGPKNSKDVPKNRNGNLSPEKARDIINSRYEKWYNTWYKLSPEERKEATKKERAAAVARAREAYKKNRGDAATTNPEVTAPTSAETSDVEAPITESPTEIVPNDNNETIPENLKEAQEAYDGLIESDKILVLTGHAELLSSESEDFAAYAKALAEAGTIRIAEPPIPLEELVKAHPEYEDTFRQAFMSEEEWKDHQEKTQDLKEAENAKYEKDKENLIKAKGLLDTLYGIRWTIIATMADSKLHQDELQNLKGFRTRKRRKELEETIRKTDAYTEDAIENYPAHEKAFTDFVKEAGFGSVALDELKKYESTLLAHGGRGPEGAPLTQALEKQKSLVSHWEDTVREAISRNDRAHIKANTEELARQRRTEAFYEEVINQLENGEYGTSVLDKTELTPAEKQENEEQARDNYVGTLGRLQKFAKDIHAEAEKLPEDQRAAFLETKQAERNALAIEVGAASRPLLLAAAEQCTTPELADEWRNDVNKASDFAIFFFQRRVMEILPALRSGNIAAAKREYDKSPDDRAKDKIDMRLKKYFGASDEFIAQLRGTDGERQQGVA